MAPKPIEDIDFPALGDKILELLLALWTLVSDFCVLLWSYVSQAFWDVWTYPSFETFRNELVAALIGLMDYVVAHPFTTTASVVLVLLLLPRVRYVLSAIVVLVLVDVPMAVLYTLSAILVLVLVVPMAVFDALSGLLLDCLGFRPRGVLRGSYAADYQSTSYGGNIPRGSAFAQFQSQGARGGGYRAVSGTGSPNWC